MPRDPDLPVAPNFALEGVITQVEDALTRIRTGDGTTPDPWDGPWATLHPGGGSTERALSWVLELLREARPR